MSGIKQNIWIYPDKEYGFYLLGYSGKMNIIYIRKSNNGNSFMHIGSYTANYMNERVLKDGRTIKYLFIDDIPNYRYVTKNFIQKNSNMTCDYYVELEETK